MPLPLSHGFDRDVFDPTITGGVCATAAATDAPPPPSGLYDDMLNQLDDVRRCGTEPPFTARRPFLGGLAFFNLAECRFAWYALRNTTGCTATCAAEMAVVAASCGAVPLEECETTEAPDSRCDVAADGSVGSGVAPVVAEAGTVGARPSSSLTTKGFD